jgi:hypothetical protein
MAEVRAFHSVAVQALDDGNIMVTIEDDLGKRNVHMGIIPTFRLALSLLRAVEEQVEQQAEKLPKSSVG